MRAWGRGVRGTAVCVEAVDRDDDDEDDDDADGAGETERGDAEISEAGGGVGVRGGDRGRRAIIVSVCKLCSDEAKRCWNIISC